MTPPRHPTTPSRDPQELQEKEHEGGKRREREESPPAGCTPGAEAGRGPGEGETDPGSGPPTTHLPVAISNTWREVMKPSSAEAKEGTTPQPTATYRPKGSQARPRGKTEPEGTETVGNTPGEKGVRKGFGF